MFLFCPGFPLFPLRRRRFLRYRMRRRLLPFRRSRRRQVIGIIRQLNSSGVDIQYVRNQDIIMISNVGRWFTRNESGDFDPTVGRIIGDQNESALKKVILVASPRSGRRKWSDREKADGRRMGFHWPPSRRRSERKKKERGEAEEFERWIEERFWNEWEIWRKRFKHKSEARARMQIFTGLKMGEPTDSPQ